MINDIGAKIAKAILNQYVLEKETETEAESDYRSPYERKAPKQLA